MLLRSALLGPAAIALAACSTTPAAVQPAATPVAAAEPVQSERDKLFALFQEADQAELDLSPLSAIFRGQYENADRIGDFYSDELQAKEKTLAESNLAKLGEIDRGDLTETDQLAYDVFKLNQENMLAEFEPEILAVNRARPINHFFGLHTFYPTFESGKSAAPFKTVKDYENAVSRHGDYGVIMDRAIQRFRDGKASGILETRLTVENMIEQLDTQLAQPIEESPYWGPIASIPEEFKAEDKARLTAAFKESIGGVYAANTRLRDYLRDEYLPVARETVGLSDMKGGAALYQKLIQDSTTLPLTAEELHELGKSEVARIQDEMEEVKGLMGFEGTLSEFFTYLRTDPKFTPESREWITEEYYRIGKIVDERIGDYFSLLPNSELEIRPYEPFREKFQAGGSYQSGAPDGSRPGVFYFNAYDLPSRPITQNVTLYLHEGAPGHHFQISIAQENEALPPFMRFGGETAYVEGWALYAETLGYEMGLYEDPVARYGTLDDEIFRAIRLVVDTGIHAKGWTREQAIEYMMANSSKGETDATAEIERYIAIPSQALAYKVGALKIQELRARAEMKLGDGFDIKAFHAEVLNTGALPLPVLEAKIDRWISSQL
ncbi:MAG: DUF885 domain-containing protein [Pseudomonadota bacterium]